jgi:predicted HD phosphohydrolase
VAGEHFVNHAHRFLCQFGRRYFGDCAHTDEKLEVAEVGCYEQAVTQPTDLVTPPLLLVLFARVRQA